MKKETRMRIIHLSVAVLLTAALAVSLGVFGLITSWWTIWATWKTS